MPGWPELARCTASIDSIRIALMQSSSTSSIVIGAPPQPRDDGLDGFRDEPSAFQGQISFTIGCGDRSATSPDDFNCADSVRGDAGGHRAQQRLPDSPVAM